MGETVVNVDFKNLSTEINDCFQLYVEYGRDVKHLMTCYGQHFYRDCAAINTQTFCRMCHLFSLKDKVRKHFKEDFNASWLVHNIFPEEFASFILYNCI